ncbi:hypothetical protein BXZ70DRAFT_1065929 [Cristinia sonorae]|uniref:GTP-binding protein 2 n=1 Tax=Cristinia sonorae TaxID=1940300 RepID=A0A8K0UKI1_9AGAR|nr:hypothetical protein BXZ70DRAFT_1065929 [Cristinia sonorae]
MFGEHESESPRVPSPWDPFLPSPQSEASSLGSTRFAGIPKLVPEVEEGNVEYKLKLTNITPARFDRLVTQLKWRLLEGGGQAYYELGVADSGALIGLARRDLEQSLETLEMMAGEIGASVIVVKEIEVPPLMVALADRLSGYLDPETGEWADKMMSKRGRVLLSSNDSLSSTPGASTEPETGSSTADSSDSENEIATPYSSPARTSPSPAATSLRSGSSDPFHHAAQSAPFISPFDDDLALFSMEPEPNVDDDQLSLDPLPVVEVDSSGISVDLEIASVYKPRPIRKRAPIVQGFPEPGQGKRGQKWKLKKQQPWHTAPRGLLTPGEPTKSNAALSVGSLAEPQLTKAQLKRQARDKRRQEKHQAFVTSHAGDSAQAPAAYETKELVLGLERMHVAVETAAVIVAPSPEVNVDKNLATLARAADKLAQLGSSIDVLLTEETPSLTTMEPRLIVEALIVRKLSLQEAYLDFSGF